jgi:hypothetical protein
MQIPIIRGIIERRILVNFRVDPGVLTKLLPEPFRPKLVAGIGMAGVCLIRLKHIRPRFIPRAFGVSSENAAHRIAVEWNEDGGELRGASSCQGETLPHGSIPWQVGGFSLASTTMLGSRTKNTATATE